jgi:hypothetical protein
MKMDEWNELDQAAEANLSPEGLRDFLAFKAELRNKGTAWADAYDDLRGFIWASIEVDDLEESDDES